MSSSRPSVDPRAVNVSVDDRELAVELVDGRRVSAPLAWFPRLLRAKPEHKEELGARGRGERDPLAGCRRGLEPRMVAAGGSSSRSIEASGVADERDVRGLRDSGVG